MNNYQRYLWFCLALVLCMVALGGVTRLTGSGLSIVEWKPISGTLPPLNLQGWEEEFAKYQTSPEYIHKNSHMNIDDFKQIFWLEYLHRLLGRIIGMVFILGAIYFSLQKNISKTLIRRNFLFVVIVATQGLMGWLMVKSGLVSNPHVSHYRLAAHLLLATLIASLVFITIKQQQTIPASANNQKFPWLIFTLIIIQVIYGAFVAGLKAGYIYNEFPLMAGSFFPPEQWAGWHNLFENHAIVQFIHRWFAFVVFVGIIWQFIKLRNKLAMLVMAVAFVQIILGIATLITGVNIILAASHQLVAILLVLAQLNLIYGGSHNAKFVK